MEPIALKYGFREDPSVTVELRSRYDDPPRWGVLVAGRALNKSGEIEYEPLPSSRDADFLERTRYDNLPDAIQAAQIYINRKKP